MKGDPGPYIETDGPHVWVPRTVPYLEARKVALQAAEYGERLAYLGKTDGELVGFTLDCRCDERCERTYDDDGDPVDDDTCRVPVWAFEIVEAR